MVTAVVEMGTLGAIRVRTKDSFIFFTLFFFLHECRERSQCFTNVTTKITMMFFFFLLSILCLRKHIWHAGRPHVALQITFRAFSWECSYFHFGQTVRQTLYFCRQRKKREENIDLKDLEQEKDFGQKLLMYKIRRDDYTSLHYCAQLKFTIWKGGVGNISKWFQKHISITL